MTLLLTGCDGFFEKEFSLKTPSNSLNGLRAQGLFCDHCLTEGNCSSDEIKQCNLIIIPARDDALSLAITIANIDRVRFLVNEVNANVKAKTGSYKETPLIISAYYGTKRHQEIAEFLISKGAVINEASPSQNGRAPLLTAIWKNNVGFVKFLLDKNADPSLSGRGTKNGTACRHAMAYGRIEIIPLIPECCSLLKQEPERLPDAVYKCQ